MKSSPLTEGHIAKPLLAFMFPILLGNILQQLYNMADTIIVGRFAGLEALAGVGAGYSLTNVFLSIAVGAGVGAAVLTGQYFGARRHRELKETISTSLLAFVLGALLLSVLSLLLLDQILHTLRVPEDAYQDARGYLKVCLLGLPFVFAYNDIASIFNSLGKSRYPLLFLVVSVFLNVLLDLLFVAVLQKGSAGAASATVLCQAVSALLASLFLRREMKKLEEEGDTRLFRKDLLGKILNLAIPSIFCQVVISFGMMVVQAAVNAFGSESLAGYTAAMRIDGIVVAPYTAISAALTSFVAQNIGAKKLERIPKATAVSLSIMLLMSALTCSIIQVWGKTIVGSFLSGIPSDKAVYAGFGYASFCGWFYFVLGVKIVMDAILRGSGDMKWFMMANVVNLAVRIFVSYAFSPIYGIAVIWYIVPVGWALCATIEIGRISTGKWKTMKVT